MHATIIKQYSSNIFIAFDGDNAGKNAAIRTGYTLLRNSINSKIINTPSDMDPDDWVQMSQISSVTIGRNPRSIKRAVNYMKVLWLIRENMDEYLPF